MVVTPQVEISPALIDWNSMPPLTRVGEGRLVVVPSPICPPAVSWVELGVFRPQQCASPVVRIPQV